VQKLEHDKPLQFTRQQMLTNAYKCLQTLTNVYVSNFQILNIKIYNNDIDATSGFGGYTYFICNPMSRPENIMQLQKLKYLAN
jgi:hypothetical protein